jgi:hypothetical protein
VAGLGYETTSGSGITDTRGTFSFQPGEPVEFSIGGVVIGSAAGQAILTPVDLVPGGSSGNATVRNIVRFLMMLDENDDPADGIAISADVQQAAANWSQVDFSAADFNNEVVTIVSDVASVDSRPAALPDGQLAQDHLEKTAHCAMSGYFRGSYTGDRSGTVVLLINPLTGMVIGTYPGSPANFESTDAVSVDEMRTFVVTATDGSGDNFEGRFDSYDEISGVWTLGSDSGQFTAQRRMADSAAVYRFTGQWYRDSVQPRLNGPLVLNVDAQGNVTGESRDLTSGNDYEATGTFDGQTFDYNWSTPGGTDAGNRAGTVDADLYVEGTGSNNAGASRPWVAQGCRLN